MKKLSIFLLILLLIYPTNIVNADKLLEDGEVILDERINFDGTKELFTELDGMYYRRFIEDDVLIDTEPIELMPTGLKITREEKDDDIGEILPRKLKQMGIYSYNLPSQLDYSSSPYLPPVGRQHENSCVGWSTGYYLRTYQQGMDLKWKIKDGDYANPSRVFSPAFIYNQINEGTDGGAFIDDAGNLLMRIGASPLSYFPYIEGDYWTQPNGEAIQAAYPHRIRDWRILYTKNDSKDYIIQKTKEYLNTGDLMVAGIKVGFKFNYPMIDHLGNAIITTDNYANYGHAIVVVGYDDNLETPEGYGAFKIINSYGKEWGNNGFAYLSYDAYVTNIEGGYVFTDLVNENYIPEIENLKGEPISPTKYKITFDKIEGVSGYRLLDENKRVILNFYNNEYIGSIDSPGRIIRYIQPFTMDGLGEMVAVEIDTRDIIQEILNTEVLEGVQFDIKFKGKGIYDVEIANITGEIVHKEKGILGQEGINTIYWNGLDLNNNPAKDGEYQIKVKDFPLTFIKQSKINNASSYSNSYNGEIKSVDININMKEEGTLNLYIESGKKKIVIYENKVLERDREFNYNVEIEKYLKDININDAKIVLEIR
ncbi:FlgD immunoglobulin-like domain containing protein [Anaerosalibacter sp. Marseille-P3206]|uniref:FlgD immunoglobulin-like domain containing protein n=1 Tax=Anaerosalibacter sp. Marseille-P3206 TaxID=1871005 RepID=UPI0013562F89|nr:FlgD immunoglobulin-like domain containing protein [Anaerosalibacter sp. Marseille-P3206]